MQGMSKSSHPDQSPAGCGGGVSPPPLWGGPTPACQHPHTLATGSLEGHLLLSFAVLLYRGGIFFPRLNMTFDKDVSAVPSQDLWGPAAEKGTSTWVWPLDPKVHLETRGWGRGGRKISVAEQRAKKNYQTRDPAL